MRNAHLCLSLSLSLSLTFSLSLLTLIALPYSEPLHSIILLSISITCHMHSIIGAPHHGSPVGPCFYSSISPYATLIFPPVQIGNPYLICSPSVFLFPRVSIWPFWKEISTDVHSLNNKADHPPPLPQLTNNKPTVTGTLYSFTCLHDVKNTTLLHLPELLDFCYQLFGNWLWLSYLMASSPRSKAFQQQRPFGTAAAAKPQLTYGSSAAAPMLLPHMVCHWHKDCSVSLLFLTAPNESSVLRKKRRKKKWHCGRCWLP